MKRSAVFWAALLLGLSLAHGQAAASQDAVEGRQAVPFERGAAPPVSAWSRSAEPQVRPPGGNAADGTEVQPPGREFARAAESEVQLPAGQDAPLDAEEDLVEGLEDEEDGENSIQDAISSDLEEGQPAGGEESAAEAPPEAESSAAPQAIPPQNTARGQRGQEHFPLHPIVARQKAFWIQIFTKYTSQQGLLHDGLIGLPVYGEVDLQGLGRRASKRFLRARKSALARRLAALAQAVEQSSPLTEAQQELLALFPRGSLGEDLREAAQNVRFQRGLANRFRRGLERSAAYMGFIRQQMRKHGVPEDLGYLPHVESSFQTNTHSKAGAAGIWQFTRSTGRIFMQVNYEVDERLDPLKSSQAAAKFLRQNYNRLGSWPLAITAYNHGPLGVARIVRHTGVENLGVLIEIYHGNRFGIASKNFYAEFLAAREVARNPEKYFPPLQPAAPLEYHEYALPFYLSTQAAARALGITVPALRRLNPALRRPVWSGAKWIPKGYTLRLPAHRTPRQFLAALPKSARHKQQKRTWVVRVRRGDTLYGLGRRYKVPWRELALANHITSHRRLLPGQKIIIPYPGLKPPTQVRTLKQQQRARAKARSRSRALVAERRNEIKLPGANTRPSSHAALPSQGLKLVRVDRRRQLGVARVAYGENLGHYAEWGQATPKELRQLNRLSRRRVLRLKPGSLVTIPLDAVTRQHFEGRRIAFHKNREAAFFAANRIASITPWVVRRGQTPWGIAQPNNVPMWLFYRKNPKLLTNPIKPGMTVQLPQVQALRASP